MYSNLILIRNKKLSMIIFRIYWSCLLRGPRSATNHVNWLKMDQVIIIFVWKLSNWFLPVEATLYITKTKDFKFNKKTERCDIIHYNAYWKFIFWTRHILNGYKTRMYNIMITMIIFWYHHYYIYYIISCDILL